MNRLLTLVIVAGSMIGWTNSNATSADSVNRLTTAEELSGWKLLFDGQSTKGWRNYRKDSLSNGWQVENGALVRAQQGAGDIVTESQYKAFELSIEYNISPGGNSGVIYHVTEDSSAPWHSGPEIQVQDNQTGRDGQKAGWLYQLFKPASPRNASDQNILDATRPAGQWNHLYVRIAPNQCEVSMNGVLYYRYKMGDAQWDQLVAKSKFAKFPQFGKSGKGHICLQDHGNLVSYRNIKIREIADDLTVPQPIHGKLNLTSVLAFPKLKWDGWEPLDDGGNVQKLRLMELTYARGDNDRLFAVSQSGEIFVFKNDANVETSHLFLNLKQKVSQWAAPGANEQGLLGLALHPNYKSNGQFFVCYTARSDDRTVVSRFSVSINDPNKADPNSEEIVLEVPQPYKNHNGGSIEFGPDGYLYVSLGDGGLRNDPSGNGQNLATLLGSILRIDVDKRESGKKYSIPQDNPFVGVPGARGEIFAFGMRNPWRIAFDKQTGLLWTGDVGQELWEEVNVVRKGGNYGWSTREGTHSFGNRAPVDNVSPPIDPIWEYDHGVGKSITGGRVYRSSRLPQLAGKYLYADYVSGSIWALTYDAAKNQAVRNEQVIASGIPVLAFGEDPNGEIYYTIDSARGECIFRFDVQK